MTEQAWRELLKRYMRHVWDEEGTPFVPAPGTNSSFSIVECELLEEIATELEAENEGMK